MVYNTGIRLNSAVVYANTEFTCFETLVKLFFGRGIVESNLVEGPYKLRLSEFVPFVNIDFLCTEKSSFLVRTVKTSLCSTFGCVLWQEEIKSAD